MTYHDPPSKTVVYDVMCKLAIAIGEKKMPFAIIVGDHPVYVLMLEMKSVNFTLLSKILPFMGSFHIQMSPSTRDSTVPVSQMCWWQQASSRTGLWIKHCVEIASNVGYVVSGYSMRC